MADVMPPLYQAWLDDMLPGPVAGETRVTCNNCVQLERPGGPPVDRPFSPQTKCCTYSPDLPNFLVGRILADTDPIGAAARGVLRERILQRINVTPLGVAPMPMYQTLYDAMTLGQTGFGRVPVMRCPLYVEEGGLCGIWRNREATCATWFCRHDRGFLGWTFWRVLLLVFRTIEMNLRFWCAERAGLAKEALAEMWAASEQGRVKGMDENAFNSVANADVYRRLWGATGDDVLGFFARCAELVAPLKFADVLGIGGASVAAAANAIRVVYDKLYSGEPLPERVVRGGAALVQIGRRPGQARVRHPALQYDWLDVDTSLVTQLGRFDSGPVSQVIAELAASGVAVDEALFRRLLDWQLFNPA